MAARVFGARVLGSGLLEGGLVSIQAKGKLQPRHLLVALGFGFWHASVRGAA